MLIGAELLMILFVQGRGLVQIDSRWIGQLLMMAVGIIGRRCVRCKRGDSWDSWRIISTSSTAF